MGYFNNTWKAKLSTGEEIRVENRNSFKKTQERIYIDDECVYSSERSQLQEIRDSFNPHYFFKVSKNFIVNKKIEHKGNIILVSMGMSHFFLNRCDIIENGDYILGSSDRARFYASFFDVLVVLWLIPLILIGGPYVVVHLEEQYKFGSKIEKSEASLWSSDFSSYKYYSFSDQLFYKMSKKWKAECEEKSNHSCRFLYYLHDNEFINLKRIDGLKYIKQACANGELRSCYSVILNKEIPKVDAGYSNAFKLMNKHCVESSLREDEMEACWGFYKIKFKEFGKRSELIADNKRLCKNGFECACEEN